MKLVFDSEFGANAARSVFRLGREIKNDKYSKLLILIFFAFGIVFVVSLIQVHRIIQASVIREETGHLAEMSETFAEHVFRTFDAADQALRYVRSQYEDWGYTGGVKTYANLGTESSKLFNQIAIADEHGAMVSTSVPMGIEELKKIDLSDRPHFKFHRDTAADVIRVGEPLVGRVSGKASIQVSRRIYGRNREFRGMIVTSLAPDYFLNFFTSVIQKGRSGEGIILVGLNDSIVRARVSGAGVGFGEDLSGNESFRKLLRNAGSDGEMANLGFGEMLIAARRIEKFGLIVIVSKDVDAINAGMWRQQRWIYLYAAFIALASSLALAVLFRARMRERRQFEELVSRENALRLANDFQARMISSVSHELRTPLTSIVGYGALLRDCNAEVSAAESHEFAKLICESAEHLGNVINGILDLSEKEKGKTTVFPEKFDVRAAVKRSVDLFSVSARSKGLNLGLKVHYSCPELWYSDKTKFTQILENLLSNAVKYTRHGGVEVRLAGLLNKFVANSEVSRG